MLRLMPLLVFCLPFSINACKTSGSQLASASALEVKGSKVDAFFQDMYKKYNKGYTIQDDPETPDDCASLYVPVDPGVTQKGVVVFFHGYTACPQQYWEFGQLLKKEGYATLSVLMPGQGRAPAPKAEGDNRIINGRRYSDYYGEFLPKVQNGAWKTYLEFVEDVNAFAKTLPGEKLLGGLSVGGELATYAYIHSPGLYKRVILMAPYYGMPGPDLFEKLTGQNVDSEALYKIQRKIVTIGSREFDQFAKLEMSWGMDCYTQTRGKGQPGRRGICDFLYENLAAINSVGAYVSTLLKDRKELTEIPEIQMVAVDWDVGSNTVLARKIVGYQRGRFGDDKVHVCFYPHSVPHSFFSRKDLINLPATPWLDSFYSQAVAFLTQGKTFQADKEPSLEFQYDGLKETDMTSKYERCAIL